MLCHTSGLSAEETLLGQYVPLHYHFNLLQDTARMASFREAIGRVVRPDMNVLELGGGTGVLSYFAAQTARHVCCIERNPALVRASRHFLELNGYGDKVQVIEGDALRFLPPEPVDVVICEMLHSGLLREKQLEVIGQFKERYTRRFGPKLPVFLPEASLLAVQPVEQDYNFHGFQAAVPLFQSPAPTHDGTTPLAEPALYATVRYDQPLPQAFEWTGCFRLLESGSVNAVRLLTKNVLAVLLDEQRSIDWSNQYLVLPLEQPISLYEGETIELSIAYEPGAALETVIAHADITQDRVASPVAA